MDRLRKSVLIANALYLGLTGFAQMIFEMQREKLRVSNNYG